MYRMAPPSRPTLKPNSSEESSAPTRGFMSSGAAQLPQSPRRQVSSPPSRHGLPSAADAATPARMGRPAGGCRRRGRPGCPDACHAGRRCVRVRCPPCGRPSTWSGGRPVSRATGVQASGVIRVSGQTRVRCPRPRQPRCPHRAGSGIHRCGGTGHVWRTGLDVSLWSVSGLVVAARIGLAGGMVMRWQCVARTSVDARPGPPLGMRAGCGAALAAWPTMEAGPAPGAGRLAGGREGAGAPKSPAGAFWAGCRRDAPHGAGPGGGDHAAWSLSWCGSHVVRRWRAHPV
jgi:hypothetical protein